MAAIAGDLTKSILGHSDADKAFRPWWDNLEDAVLYSFVVMGKEFYSIPILIIVSIAHEKIL